MSLETYFEGGAENAELDKGHLDGGRAEQWGDWIEWSEWTVEGEVGLCLCRAQRVGVIYTARSKTVPLDPVHYRTVIAYISNP